MHDAPSLDRAETPVAVLDLDRVRQNARKVADYCREHGLVWRPHIKTHKSRPVARIQLEAGAGGLTVATPREAEVMASVSDDLLLAYPPVGETKLDRILSLDRDVALRVALDSREALEGLAGAARSRGRQVGVLVEVDVGLERVGVPAPGDAIELARRARDLEGVSWEGVLFYPGHIRVSQEEQSEPLASLATDLEKLLEKLAAADLSPKIVSGGSSPTLWQSHRLPGLTEIRPGTCIFMDRDMVALGVCGRDALAYSVLTTVVSTAVPGQVVVDAGSKALAKEPLRADLRGFGEVLGRPEVTVSALSEEHGTLDLEHSRWRPRIGERVRLVPNHVCVSANLQDRYLVLDDGEGSFWPLEARGRSPAC